MHNRSRDALRSYSLHFLSETKKMVDPSDIKKTYAAMSDAELRHFASNEGASLTMEAFQILKSEFSSRLLPSDIIESIEDGSHLAELASLKKIVSSVPEQASVTALASAINEKRDGKSDDLIIYHLMEQGLEEEHARIIVGQIKPEAVALLRKANAAMLTSAFIMCAGIALKLISPEKSIITFLDIAATCTMIFGGLKFLKSLFDLNKLKTVIRNLEKEE